MKEIVVISGKGGTGKTSVTASFAWLGGGDLTVADCDVDAADMHLLMRPGPGSSELFYSGYIAEIDPQLCTACGRCEQVCRFGGVTAGSENFVINADCEGCGYCERICPTGAISMTDQLAGELYVSQISTGADMVHARLRTGAENSGKLVARVKQRARELAESRQKRFILVDGSPGIGCPVVSSLSGADLALIVTEPTVSGLHDLRRILEVARRFNARTACIINKADLNGEIAGRIKEFLQEQGIACIAEFAYDRMFTQAMLAGKPLTEYGGGESSERLAEAWEQVCGLAER